MAEGGLLAWKLQKLQDQPPYVDFSPDTLLKALPPLPTGLEWTRQSDGNWAISACQAQGTEDTENAPPQPALPAFLEHVIMPEDTLVGICLRYRVSKKELHHYNDFFGEHFRLCKVLRIPNKFTDVEAVAQLQPRSREVDLQRFRYESGLGMKEAAFYLETNDWSLALALLQFRGDTEWESAHVEGAAAAAPPRAGANRHHQQAQQQQQQRSAKHARPPRMQAVTGTSGAAFAVGDDGTIEMVPSDADQTVPLLAASGGRSSC
ncbi:hypothetical protein JKP88DRAFT_297360 [Tribonema minus]|uniref:Uncharacterized protein n=1 Tax=Tribonema minus TaxID=303371 RepID=A0A836CLF6_9STRA|nr:hypothetical protein JKP88DRAFT_297360 [Tribonema minus]